MDKNVCEITSCLMYQVIPNASWLSSGKRLPKILVKIATKAGAYAGAKLGAKLAAENGATAGRVAGAAAGKEAGAEAGAVAAAAAAKAEAAITLKEALKNLSLHTQVFNIFPNGTVIAAGGETKLKGKGTAGAAAGGTVAGGTAGGAAAGAGGAAAGASAGGEIYGGIQGGVSGEVKVDVHGMPVPTVEVISKELVGGNLSVNTNLTFCIPKRGENADKWAREYVDKRGIATRSKYS